MFQRKVSLRVQKEIWKKVREKCQHNTGNSELAEAVLQEWIRNIDIKEEKEKLSRELDELKTEYMKASKENRKVKRDYDRMMERYNTLRSHYARLKQDYDEVIRNPIVEERIIYKEDKKAIEALNRKTRKLERKNWRLQRNLDIAREEKKALEAKVVELQQEIESLKRRNYGILCVGNSTHSKKILEQLGFELIDSSSYYYWKERKKEFEASRNLEGKPYVIRLFEWSFR